MCGIAGLVRLDGGTPERGRLEAMGAAIAHRGPDGQGTLIDGNVGLVHRRLAIIDLATGDQPMGNEDGSVSVIFNGEIYDFHDVQPRLEAAGHRFKTHSDTEVIVHGWEEWGTKVPEKLNGMFAFAILDRTKRKLFLARDRLGVKPLYWHKRADAFVFASEMSAILAAGGVEREVDREALDLYLHYQYVPAPWTIYRSVKKLEPGCWLELDLTTGAHRTGRYWRLDGSRSAEQGRPLDSWRDELKGLLLDAVRIRLISDVPFGAFLSGGTDSGVVVAMMAAQLSEPVRTFSIGIEGTSAVDELPRAARVAERFHTRHEVFRVAPEGLSLLPELVRHFGEPFADSSAIPTWYVSKLARSRVKMVLTGDGGDEMFAGYRSYSGIAGARADGLPSARSVARDGSDGASLARRARRLAAALGHVVRSRSLPKRRSATSWTDVYDSWMRHFSLDDRGRLLGRDSTLSAEAFAPDRFPHPGADSVVAAAQFCDVHSYLPDDVLTKVDRMSMANSLEVRSPLLDYRIAELAFRMPTEVKLRDVVADASNGKRVLKEVAAEYLTREYVYAPKEGFGIPVDKWLREDRTGYVRDTLLAGDAPLYSLVDRGTAVQFVREHLEGRTDHSSRVWSLLVLDAWLRNVDVEHSLPLVSRGVEP